MATVALTEFLPHVLPQVPGCADILAVHAIREAAIEFCERSLAAREEQAAQTLTAADLPLDVAVPTGARLVKVLAVTLDGSELDVAAWRQPNPTQLTLISPPSASFTLALTVAYAPLRNASSVDDWLYQHYADGIAAGALARLMSMAAMPFANPELAMFKRAAFLSAIDGARIEALHQWRQSSLQMASVRFG